MFVPRLVGLLFTCFSFCLFSVVVNAQQHFRVADQEQNHAELQDDTQTSGAKEVAKSRGRPKGARRGRLTVTKEQAAQVSEATQGKFKGCRKGRKRKGITGAVGEEKSDERGEKWKRFEKEERSRESHSG